MRRVLAIVLSVLTVAAQQQQQPAADTKTPTFSAGTNLVIIDVTVRDKSGKLIEGLTQKDFQVLEDGKRQTAKIFEFEKLSLDPAPPEKPPSLDDANDLPDPPVKQITT